MPVIDDVRLVVAPGGPRVITTTITVRVSMSRLEACFARQCLDGLNEEWRVTAAIYGMNFGNETFQPLAIVGTQNLDWPAGSNTKELVFVASFPAGRTLNEDNLGRDEIAPKAEVRTRQAGVFVTNKRGNVVTGFF